MNGFLFFILINEKLFPSGRVAALELFHDSLESIGVVAAGAVAESGDGLAAGVAVDPASLLSQ